MFTDFTGVIQAIGRGPTRSRHLTFDESHWVMDRIWAGEVNDLQLGGLLVAWRLLGEQPEEVAGLVAAVREKLPQVEGDIDLDLPAYAGKRRLPPYFVHAAWQLAREGHKILIHGSIDPTSGRYYAEQACRALNVPVATSLENAATLFARHNLVYLPFEAFAAPLSDKLFLKPRLGVRTIFNSLCKMINPLRAPVSVQGIFHGVYASLHAEVAARLNDPCVISFKGEGGEPEIRPTATTPVQIARSGQIDEITWPRTLDARPSMMDDISMEALLRRIEQNSLTDYDRAALEANTAFLRNALKGEKM